MCVCAPMRGAWDCRACVRGRQLPQWCPGSIVVQARQPMHWQSPDTPPVVPAACRFTTSSMWGTPTVRLSAGLRCQGCCTTHSKHLIDLAPCMSTPADLRCATYCTCDGIECPTCSTSSTRVAALRRLPHQLQRRPGRAVSDAARPMQYHRHSVFGCAVVHV